MADYVAMARAAAERAGINSDYFTRQIQQESGFNPKAGSPAGAQGIAQIMPATARDWGVDPWDPEAALEAAAQHMAGYLNQYGGDWRLALAAYNAGPGNVAKYGGVPPFEETQRYIRSILGDSNPVQGASGGGKPMASPLSQEETMNPPAGWNVQQGEDGSTYWVGPNGEWYNPATHMGSKTPAIADSWRPAQVVGGKPAGADANGLPTKAEPAGLVFAPASPAGRSTPEGQQPIVPGSKDDVERQDRLKREAEAAARADAARNAPAKKPFWDPTIPVPSGFVAGPDGELHPDPNNITPKQEADDDLARANFDLGKAKEARRQAEDDRDYDAAQYWKAREDELKRTIEVRQRQVDEATSKRADVATGLNVQKQQYDQTAERAKFMTDLARNPADFVSSGLAMEGDNVPETGVGLWDSLKKALREPESVDDFFNRKGTGAAALPGYNAATSPSLGGGAPEGSDAVSPAGGPPGVDTDGGLGDVATPAGIGRSAAPTEGVSAYSLSNTRPGDLHLAGAEPTSSIQPVSMSELNAPGVVRSTVLYPDMPAQSNAPAGSGFDRGIQPVGSTTDLSTGGGRTPASGLDRSIQPVSMAQLGNASRGGLGAAARPGSAAPGLLPGAQDFLNKPWLPRTQRAQITGIYSGPQAGHYQGGAGLSPYRQTPLGGLRPMSAQQLSASSPEDLQAYQTVNNQTGNRPSTAAGSLARRTGLRY